MKMGVILVLLVPVADSPEAMLSTGRWRATLNRMIHSSAISVVLRTSKTIVSTMKANSTTKAVLSGTRPLPLHSLTDVLGWSNTHKLICDRIGRWMLATNHYGWQAQPVQGVVINFGFIVFKIRNGLRESLGIGLDMQRRLSKNIVSPRMMLRDEKVIAGIKLLIAF